MTTLRDALAPPGRPIPSGRSRRTTSTPPPTVDLAGAAAAAIRVPPVGLLGIGPGHPLDMTIRECFARLRIAQAARAAKFAPYPARLPAKRPVETLIGVTTHDTTSSLCVAEQEQVIRRYATAAGCRLLAVVPVGDLAEAPSADLLVAAVPGARVTGTVELIDDLPSPHLVHLRRVPQEPQPPAHRHVTDIPSLAKLAEKGDCVRFRELCACGAQRDSTVYVRGPGSLEVDIAYEPGAWTEHGGRAA